MDPSQDGLELDAATIPYLKRLMDSGALTAAALTERYLERISEIDGAVNAVLLVNPTARDQATESDLTRRRRGARSPLEGIPVLLKDSVDTADLATTAGSRALCGTPPKTDATVVGRLRAAGAVILGKANMSEWSNFRAWRCTSGWSGVGGQTNNPHVLDRNPGGSSSGCAAAIAASLAQVAIGVETDGSILAPAGLTGVVGLKPTLGLVSRAGIVPSSAEQDTPGPIARHVVDVAVTLAAIQGPDPADPATAAIPPDRPAGYVDLLDPAALAGTRIGIWRHARCDPDVDVVVRAAAKILRAAGAVWVEVELPYQDEIGANAFPALLSELRRDLEGYLAGRPGAPATLAQLVEFNRRDPVELSRFGQELLEDAATAPATDHPDYLERRRAATAAARRCLDETMAAHRLDAIMTPSNSPAWRTDYVAGDACALTTSAPAAVAGYPSITVPAGFAGSLPVGVSFGAGRWADMQLLRIAFGFEQAAGARRPPGYLPALPAWQRWRRSGPGLFVRRLVSYPPPRRRPAAASAGSAPGASALPTISPGNTR